MDNLCHRVKFGGTGWDFARQRRRMFLCVFAGSVYVARLLGFSYSEAVTAWHDTPWFQYHTWS